MQRLVKFACFLILAYNWPIAIALAILDAAKIDIRPQGKRSNFSPFQIAVMFLIASFFSTLIYIVPHKDIVDFIKIGPIWASK